MTSGTEKRARPAHLTVRLSAEERAAVDAAAGAAGLTAGSYAREAMLGGPAPREVRRPPAEREELVRLLAALGKIGSNLNQLAHAANTGTVLYSDEIAATLASLREVRDALLKALGREK
jgi:hypothetical protein